MMVEVMTMELIDYIAVSLKDQKAIPHVKMIVACTQWGESNDGIMRMKPGACSLNRISRSISAQSIIECSM